MKRALIFVGAGASIDYGAPGTWAATRQVASSALANGFLKSVGGHHAIAIIARRLATYLGGRNSVNFEQIFHCAHELMFTYPPTPGAVNAFKPIMNPFLDNSSRISQGALKLLAEHIIRALYDMFSTACASPRQSVVPLGKFLESVRKSYVTRIYTTNYDDFILQANPDLYYGYSGRPSTSPKRFDVGEFRRSMDRDCVLHLHGSIHMGFAVPSLQFGDMGDLFWYDDRSAARSNAIFSGALGSTRRMDGSSYLPTSIITGLDKTSSIQQSPFLHFYSSLGHDASTADVIFVIGSGLSDLHINAWLREARDQKRRVPILFVDRWSAGLAYALMSQFDQKLVEMFHALKIHIAPGMPSSMVGIHWTISGDGSSAVWDDGFTSFLAAPNDLAQVLRQMAISP